ncbi:group II intron reverse transcriptase/maturase [Chryseobacterium piscicola]|uniref:RNA-directed DNA polymerase n=1 Tax=Chryseobacterium piscicola TaxID=551459 RepID=A0A1N7PJV8_9FLAO|nr:group II intron reverse transcriptase/maturase [Chryseobacterium piscicola]PQA93921.1 group II intron reverse transcriptase/maturase [Chryseobacterium piscicola]SIT10915.1 group II intron reverse transcriptase/maturase [Chryseobacterium piscicola]
MIERVLHPRNMQRALQQVIANKGSAGVDGMNVQELSDYLRKEKTRLYSSIKERCYLPQPILGVEIPKAYGKTRLLGIPTVTDRVLQQAVSQVLMPHYENEFSVHSYGFRPNKNARQAVGKALEHIHEGYPFIVDIDLKTFFDEVDHCILLNLLYRKVKCPVTMRLIRKWLRAPILINGQLQKRRKGVPQGSPLSPLLSNILLNELDKELTKRKLRFVRYADDFSIYTQYKSHATATLKAIEKYLKTKLKLTINGEKSGVRKPVQFELLGFGFESTYKKGDKGKYQLVVGKKAWTRLKERLKSLTRKTAPISFDERIQKINEVQRGWLNYFRGTSIKGKLMNFDGWLRNRLRYCIWHDWKKPERKRKNLIRLGIDQSLAYAYSRTRKGGWAVAQSPILGTTITISRLKKRGYIGMLELHLSLNPSIYEPPYTRPVRTVV